MLAHINGRVAAHKLTHTVERFTRRGKVVKYNRELVLVECLVNIGDVGLEHIKQTVVFRDDKAVAVGVSFRLDEINAVRDLLTFGEVIVRAVGKLNRNNIIDSLKLVGRTLLLVDINLCVREGLQLSGMVAVLMSEQDFCDLLGLVA